MEQRGGGGSGLDAARSRAAARAASLRDAVVPPLALRQVRPASPPTRSRTQLGSPPTREEAHAAATHASTAVGKAELASMHMAKPRPTGRLEPAMLRRTEQAQKQLASMLAMWAMFARGRRANRKAREAEDSLEGRTKAAAKRATANVRASTGRTFATTDSSVKEQICQAFARPDGGVGLPWPHRPRVDSNEVEVDEAGDKDHELGVETSLCHFLMNNDRFAQTGSRQARCKVD
jgi:hypothetical protein